MSLFYVLQGIADVGNPRIVTNRFQPKVLAARLAMLHYMLQNIVPAFILQVNGAKLATTLEKKHQKSVGNPHQEIKMPSEPVGQFEVSISVQCLCFFIYIVSCCMSIYCYIRLRTVLPSMPGRSQVRAMGAGLSR